MKALVIGGGVGGVTAAIALRRKGVDAVVFEKAPELKPVGAGLHLWTNAFRALRHIELDERVAAVGTEVESSRFMTAEGKVIVEWPMAEISRELGGPTVGVARADLHRVLLDTLGKDALVLNAELVEFEQDAEGVTARFRDGREERGDVLIGADGLRSVVRRQLHGDAKPRYAGYSAWRAITPFQHERMRIGWFTLHWGRGARMVTYRVGEGKIYWLALFRTPEGGTDPEGGRKAAALARYKDFDEPVLAMIEAADEAAIIRTDIVDRLPTRKWGEGRVTLLGDAAHPMTPNLAQGACQSIEDGIVVAGSLNRQGATAEALRDYEQRRMDRTAHYVKDSWSIGAIGTWSNPIACAIRTPALWYKLKYPVLRQHRRDMQHELYA